MSIVSLDTLKLYMKIPETDDSKNDELELYLDAVNGWIPLHCHRTFTSASYTNQLYNGNGRQTLRIINYPITAIAQISVDREDGIRIKNTAGDASNAYVTVDQTEAQLTLTVSGGDDAGTNSLAFETYTTLATLVTQIDATGDGWDAAMANANLDDILTTELFPTMGLYCGSRGNKTAGWVDLQIPGEPISDFMYDTEIGELYRSGGWDKGYQNVSISYTAGYSSTTMPAQLKKAALMAIKALYDKASESGFGVARFSAGHLSVSYDEYLPDECLKILDFYRPRLIA